MNRTKQSNDFLIFKLLTEKGVWGKHELARGGWLVWGMEHSRDGGGEEWSGGWCWGAWLSWNRDVVHYIASHSWYCTCPNRALTQLLQWWRDACEPEGLPAFYSHSSSDSKCTRPSSAITQLVIYLIILLLYLCVIWLCVVNNISIPCDVLFNITLHPYVE